MRAESVFLGMVIAMVAACRDNSTAPGGGPPNDSGPSDGGTVTAASVLEHHMRSSRDGVYIDPAFTRSAAAGLHRDGAFSATIDGAAYAQPLFVDAENAGRDLLFVATEQNTVYALNATTGSVVWQRNLGSPVRMGDLLCGDIDPLGVTGTPIIDLPSRTLFVDAMTTPDGGSTKKHLIFGLSIDDGSTRAGWPVDVSAIVTAPVPFDSSVQNQRGALALLNGVVYVPYGAHAGDCGEYRGWVLGFPLASPSSVVSWHTRALGGGIWTPTGIASDGTSLFVATGNSIGAIDWSDGEAMLRLAPGAVFSGQSSDFFSPVYWPDLDSTDADLSGSGPVLFTVPGSSPSKLAAVLGKDGKAYLLDPANLGGIGPALFSRTVARNPIINSPAAYTGSNGTYVAFKGLGQGCPSQSGDLIAIRIDGSPPSLSIAWCATQNGNGSPAVTTTDGHSNAIVWSVGAEGDNLLHGIDGETGAVIFGGGGVLEAMENIPRFQTPIAAKGRIYVAGNGRVYAFRP